MLRIVALVLWVRILLRGNYNSLHGESITTEEIIPLDFHISDHFPGAYVIIDISFLKSGPFWLQNIVSNFWHVAKVHLINFFRQRPRLEVWHLFTEGIFDKILDWFVIQVIFRVKEFKVFLAIHLLEEKHQTLGFIIIFLFDIITNIKLRVLIGSQTFKFLNVIIPIRCNVVAQGAALYRRAEVIGESRSSLLLHGRCDASTCGMAVPIRNELRDLSHSQNF